MKTMMLDSPSPTKITLNKNHQTTISSEKRQELTQGVFKTTDNFQSIVVVDMMNMTT
jgi:hypothetical protein